MPPMFFPRTGFVSAAVAGCIVVACGYNRTSAEVYDEMIGRWFRLPRDLPLMRDDGFLAWAGGALL